LVREKRLGNTQERVFFGTWNHKLSRRLPMLCNLSTIKIIRNQMRYNRNLETRKKVILFLMAFRYQNISLACLKLGYQRSYFYFWFNRLKEADFDIKSLEERSRRPGSHPKKTPIEIVDKIISLRKQTNYGPDRLQYHLEQLHNIHLPRSTIGHILKREDLIPPKRLKHRKKHLKRYQEPNPGDKVQADVKYVPYRVKAQQHYQYTAIDDCTRWRFAKIYYDLSVNNTEEFIKELIRAAPFKIKTIQTDNGIEFTYKFVSDPKCMDKEPKEHPLDILCKKHNIHHKLIPLGQCEINGKVERSHRIDEEEFYRLKTYTSLKELQLAFNQWILYYNHKRPHGGIDKMTPIQKLNLKLNSS
jgi:transposase InsO family protein